MNEWEFSGVGGFGLVGLRYISASGVLGSDIGRSRTFKTSSPFPSGTLAFRRSFSHALICLPACLLVFPLKKRKSCLILRLTTYRLQATYSPSSEGPRPAHHVCDRIPFPSLESATSILKIIAACQCQFYLSAEVEEGAAGRV